MNLTSRFYEIFPLITTLCSAVIFQFYNVGRKWQDYIIYLLGIMFLFFCYIFFTEEFSSTLAVQSLFDIRYHKISIFVGALYSGSLFVGLFPIRRSVNLSPTFLFYIFGGFGIILSNNLPTFFVFWTFQRFLPIKSFVKEGTNGTYIFQHVLTWICFIILLFLADQQNLLVTPMTEIPASFFTWPVLILSFIIIYESHGIFPFHSWVHDIAGKVAWYEFSVIFLSRAGILLFVQLLLPTLKTDPDLFRILLLALSIISSIYWSLRAFLEKKLMKATTYFYIAQASLLLTGLQANMTAVKGAYLHMLVISFSSTALFSILSYIQKSFSFKRDTQFYGMAQFYPKLSTLFCLFGFCLIGVPMGASFVVEDLVINGLLENQPNLGLGHILATALNGIVFFHLLGKIFLGPSPFNEQIKNKDMSLFEMFPYFVILVLLISIGLMPHLFLEKITW